ncbi:unnamed protein product [Urochloa decumbens]|uniref:Uncharacterized protein n=1 Tax=Urochloa decumbens TaxID=240449 RepID=A0ABC8YIW0_9POAL
MQAGSGAQPTSEPEEVDIPGRPDYVNSFVHGNRRAPATAVRWVTPERERRTSRPHTAAVYMPAPPPLPHYGFLANASITPRREADADPAPSIRAAIGAALPALRFMLLPPAVHGGDRTVCQVWFLSHEDLEAALARQPLPLDGGAATVKLVRGELVEPEATDVERTVVYREFIGGVERETTIFPRSRMESGNEQRLRLETLVHVELRDYPREQRNVEDIRKNCCSFGHLFEVDPACFGAPDMSPVRAVVRTEHAREVPRQVRIRWPGRLRHVVPVRVLRVWDWSESVDANGEYVPIYGPDARVTAWISSG